MELLKGMFRRGTTLAKLDLASKIITGFLENQKKNSSQIRFGYRFGRFAWLWEEWNCLRECFGEGLVVTGSGAKPVTIPSQAGTPNCDWFSGKPVLFSMVLEQSIVLWNWIPKKDS